ncbi:MAG TPA: deoxyguanosinetriphosphate triphosphohydrolase [Candidatus Tripitaka californicus]|uniref:deoxyguanosinetriphosphate triphosphohydrolase n=1 Tax=Candidatus Tripitaka californicus TaxID=3367616 RepID=UPI004029445D|nr:deoxyguanosinetriphosphate triphosphohydrolase [Planctomycetota bacterium]
MIYRKDIELREEKELASYATKSKDSRGRKYPEEEHPYRSIYQRDKDRIIHSTAFRRLEYKTQVFVNHEGDYYRTRLTHTIEVAQISRCLARTLNINEDLAEAIALAHDLGHTPFGHSGEEALCKLMEGQGGFEHNLQALRVVDVLERRYPNFPGLNLSWEVRESILKHNAAREVLTEFNPKEKPLLEAQVVDKADSIAYDTHDLDDSLKAGLINEGALHGEGLWRYASEKVASKWTSLDSDNRRAQTIIFLINLQVTDLIENTQKRLEELGVKGPEEVRHCRQLVVDFSPEISERKRSLEKFLGENVYMHYRVARMADKARRFVEELFKAFVANPRQLPPDFQAWAEKEGIHRGVCDYIAGMTDRYAQDEYLRLFHPYERV